MKLVHLDCTLRDGGYYNNWNFDKDMVESYLQSMKDIKVDYVELGFRSISTKGFKGPYAHTTDDFINTLKIPRSLKIGVMVNASELFNPGNTPIGSAKKLFGPKKDSPVSLIRFACHGHEFKKTINVCDWLKSQGYKVGINLMQISEMTEEAIKEYSEAASRSNLDVFYFADSLGSIIPDDMKSIVKSIKTNWNGDIGIHTHDNLGLAMNNSIEAINNGVSWIDSTVTGMGRGPGNLQTEYAILEFKDIVSRKPNISSLTKMIKTFFTPLQKHYEWGKNPYYYLSGKYKIHPTYIQEMLSDDRYDDNDVLSLIDYLKKVGGKKYSKDNVINSRALFTKSNLSTWEPAKTILNKDILIIAPGASVKEHLEGIEQYIKKNRPIVLALNTTKCINEKLINFRVACHPYRMIADAKDYKSLKQPLITPYSQLSDDLQKDLKGVKKRDFGICISSKFSFGNKKCNIPLPLVFAYSLGIATSGKAKKIFLAGFDGYESDDPRRFEMDQLLSLYNSSSKSKEIISLTPTKYKINTFSLYGL